MNADGDVDPQDEDQEPEEVEIADDAPEAEGEDEIDAEIVWEDPEDDEAEYEEENYEEEVGEEEYDEEANEDQEPQDGGVAEESVEVPARRTLLKVTEEEWPDGGNFDADAQWDLPSDKFEEARRAQMSAGRIQSRRVRFAKTKTANPYDRPDEELSMRCDGTYHKKVAGKYCCDGMCSAYWCQSQKIRGFVQQCLTCLEKVKCSIVRRWWKFRSERSHHLWTCLSKTYHQSQRKKRKTFADRTIRFNRGGRSCTGM